jgi:hypothetical protein
MQPHDGAGAIFGINCRKINPDKLGGPAANIDNKKLFGARRFTFST